MRTRRSNAILVSSVILGALAPVRAPAAGSAFGSPVRLDTPGRTEIPSFASDERIAFAGPRPVVVFRDDRDLREQTRSSYMDGAVWHDERVAGVKGRSLVASDGARAWMLSSGDGLASASSSGDGAWQQGPGLNVGSLGVPSVAAGAGGVVAMAWGGPQICVVAFGAGTPAQASAPTATVPAGGDGARVAILDAATSTFSDIEPVLSDVAISSVAIAVGPDRRVWLAAVRVDGADDGRILVTSRDPSSGAWSVAETLPLQAFGRVALAVLADGEVVLAEQTQGLVTRVRSALLHRWSEPTTVAPRADSIRLVTPTASAELPIHAQVGATLAWSDGGAIYESSYTPSLIAEVPGTWTSDVRVVASDVWSWDLSAAPDGTPWLGYVLGNDAYAKPGDDPAIRVRMPAMYAASKSSVALSGWGGRVMAVWGDDRGATIPGQRLQRSEAETAAPLPGPHPMLSSVVASGGSVAQIDEGRVGVIAADGTVSRIDLPRGVWPLVASLGDDSFVAGWRVPAGWRYAVYRGSWLAPVTVRLPRDTSVGYVTNAGAGYAWFLASSPGDPPVTKGIRVSAHGYKVMPLFTGNGNVIGMSGDGAGVLAIAWEEPSGDNTRLMFRTSEEAPTVVQEIAPHLWSVSVAATPSGDAALMFNDGALGGFRRIGGASFEGLPSIALEQREPSTYPWCSYLAIRPLPAAPEMAFDGAGTLDVFFTTDAVRMWSMPLDQTRWARTDIGSISAYGSSTSLVRADGDVVAEWVSGALDDLRVLAAIRDEDAMPTRMTLAFSAGSAIARLTTPRGLPVVGKTISFHLGGSIVDALTDASGAASVPTTVSTGAASFAGDHNFQGSMS